MALSQSRVRMSAWEAELCPVTRPGRRPTSSASLVVPGCAGVILRRRRWSYWRLHWNERRDGPTDVAPISSRVQGLRFSVDSSASWKPAGKSSTPAAVDGAPEEPRLPPLTAASLTIFGLSNDMPQSTCEAWTVFGAAPFCKTARKDNNGNRALSGPLDIRSNQTLCVDISKLRTCQ